jgi:branched-chain amino acid transport system permease protein
MSDKNENRSGQPARARPSGGGMGGTWNALVRRVSSSRIPAVLLLVFFLILPRFLPGQHWVRVLDNAGLYIMMALGLNLIAGQTGLISLGYVALFAVGSYTYAILASQQLGHHFPFLLLFPLAGALAGVFGFLLAVPALSLKGSYLVMVTLGFSEIVRFMIHNLKWLTGGTQGIRAIYSPQLLFYTLESPRDYYYLLLAVCVIEILVMRRIERSRIGRAWAAMREDEGAAKTTGLNTRALRLLVCAIGSIPAGLAGAINAPLMTYIEPQYFVIDESITILSMVVIGGLGNAPGVVLGALILTVLPEPLRRYAQEYRLLIYGAILILFTLFRPQGLLPRQYARRGSEEPEDVSNEAASSTEATA